MFSRIHKEKQDKENKPHISLPGKILMVIGFLTVLYFAIVYLIMPALAIITKATGM